MLLSDLHKLLKKTRVPVFHYEADQEDLPYIVYFEYDEGHLEAENSVIVEFDYVQVSYFTNKDNDATVNKIKKILNKYEIPYKKKILYERDIDVIHYVFDCELI